MRYCFLDRYSFYALIVIDYEGYATKFYYLVCRLMVWDLMASPHTNWSPKCFMVWDLMASPHTNWSP